MKSHIDDNDNPAKTAMRGFGRLLFWLAAIIGVFFGCGAAIALAGPFGLLIFLIAVSYVAGRRVFRPKPAAPVKVAAAPAPAPLAQAPQPRPVAEASRPLPSPSPSVLHVTQQARAPAPVPAQSEWATTRE